MKANFKLMMVGSLEADIEDACNRPDEADDVIDDFEDADKDVPIQNMDVYLSKVQRRIKDYQINILNPPREGKKLLVLDIDYTLFDHRSAAESGTSKKKFFRLESNWQQFSNVFTI